MANYKVTDSELSGIASAIRLKGGTSDPLVFPSGFVSAISAIETQGTYISKTITSNGEYNPASDNADAFSHVTVSVPSPVLVSKTISSNGTYNPADDNADAYSQVVVSVPTSGGSDNYGLEVILEGISGSVYCSTITSLRSGAITSNSGITELNLPQCENIGESAFYNCGNLSRASLENCKQIGISAFAQCSKLSDISLPKCVSINNMAFFQCSVLSKAILPSCERINMMAFQNCYNLLNITLLASVVVSLPYSNVLDNTPIAGRTTSTGGVLGSVYVPESLVDSYKSATNWSYFSDRITSYVEE